MVTGRRSFVRRTLGGAIGALFAGSARELNAEPAAQGDAWLDAIANKKHKAFLDVGVFDTSGGPFRRTKALMLALRESYGVSDSEIGVAFGAHSSGLGYMLTPAIWDKLGLVSQIAGSNLRAVEAQAVLNATRNWGTLGAENVAQLRERGVRLLACRQTIGRWADSIATKRGVPAPEILAEIIGGLHPGVETVPAMIVAAVVAQERGVPYVTL